MKSNLIKQSNEITLSKQDLTKKQRDCFYLIVNEINRRKIKNELIDGAQLYKIEIPTEKIRKMCGISHISEYSETFKSLTEKSVGIAKSDGFVWISLLAKSEYKSGDSSVSVYIVNDLIPYFLEIAKKFTVYDIDIVVGFRSSYTQRFYEICNMFASMGKFTMSLSMLRERFNLVGYNNYSNLKARVLNTAKKEMEKFYNEGKCDIKFDYKPSHFIGKQVDELEFTITTRDIPKCTCDSVYLILAIIKSISGKNEHYIEYVDSEIRKLCKKDADKLYERLKKMKNIGELNHTLTNVILKDFGIDYEAYKKESKESIVNGIASNFNGTYITEKEARKCIYAEINSNGERRIVSHIIKKQSRGEKLYDFEEYFRRKLMFNETEPKVRRNVEGRKKVEESYEQFGIEYI